MKRKDQVMASPSYGQTEESVIQSSPQNHQILEQKSLLDKAVTKN